MKNRRKSVGAQTALSIFCTAYGLVSYVVLCLLLLSFGAMTSFFGSGETSVLLSLIVLLICALSMPFSIVGFLINWYLLVKCIVWEKTAESIKNMVIAIASLLLNVGLPYMVYSSLLQFIPVV